MPALDTNVLVRYVVQDDPRQARVAQRYIEQSANQDVSLFLPTSVILETEWVLRSVYLFSKDAVMDVFVGLLDAREMIFQDEPSFERAVFLYREHNIDFADCLHLATAHTFDHLPLFGFEKKAGRVPGFEFLRA
jgi:predicted nucleic-acid-binding protein